MASTPSSYIPTNGSTVTRAAETLTAPSANLPWWTDDITYLSDELVTNGTFDADLSGWTDLSVGTGSVSQSSGEAVIERVDGSNQGILTQGFSTTIGETYVLTLDKSGDIGTVRVGTTSDGTDVVGDFIPDNSVFKTFVAASATTYVTLRGGGNPSTVNYDNVSVREIKTPAISIAMEGTMTYADDGGFSTVIFWDWIADAPNKMRFYLDTSGGRTGTPAASQEENDTFDVSFPSGRDFTPGVNVPFNIASRHGATFVNGAVDGAAFTADTTPTALPDLSSTDLEIAPDFMGTIKTLRIWADDLGDSGIEGAST